ncbi:alpha/beta hydrolase [Wenzhouxiangella sp. XN79A]|uniref:alpha/beta fold hydrolase n=1 Tax=Wenzhouxiangella sp. XN79A TaxID=2724193 RepID=UPI00197DC6C3|nr:alpha/beta hydrolase [Wenzhouxiangella sp. XN79A]
MDIPIPLQTWRDAGRVEPILGHALFFRDHGEGVPVLLLHGFPTASWDWSWLWRDLVADHRLIAPDLLGFGFSAKPAGHDYSIADQADRLEDLLERLGVVHFHVLAHDYGDTVAQELLARRNQGTGAWGLLSVCFLNGGLFPESHRPRLIQRLLCGPLGPLLARTMSRKRFAKSFSAVFGPQSQPSEAELDAFWALIDANDGRRVVPALLGYMRERRQNRARWTGALQAAKVPIGLVNGVLDPVSGRHLVDRYREVVGNDGFIEELADVGHYPQVEAPDAVASAYRRFIQSVAADGS